MSLSIRPAAPADIPTIARIYAHAVNHGTASFELTPPDEVEMARRMRELLAGNYPYLAAEADGAFLGYAYAALHRARPAYRFTVEDSVYVAPEAQGCGVGRILLTALIEAAGGLGYRQMIAVIGDSENTASVALHAALGFAHIGTLPHVGYKFGRWLDTVLMQRPLGFGAMIEP